MVQIVLDVAMLPVQEHVMASLLLRREEEERGMLDIAVDEN